MMIMSRKIENEKRAKNARFEVKKNHRKVVRRRNARRMILKKSRKSKNEVLAIQMNIHPANVAAKSVKRRKRNNQQLPRQLKRVNPQICQQLRKFAVLLT
jgi:hypothetical protein